MNFKKTVLPNGVRIITAPMQGNPTATVMVAVATGSFYEKPEQAGLSHFLEHMFFKGTTKRPSAFHITSELDSIGALYNAFTSKDMTGYWAKADAKHFGRIADVVTDVFKNSTFPEKEVEKEKGVVMGEIDMYADDPQEKIGDAVLKHMYGGEPAERDVLGTKQTVSAITRDELIAYRDAQYTGPNIVVTLAGGVAEADMLAWAKANFGDAPRTPPPPEFLTYDRSQKGPETVFIDKDTDQAHIILAWRTFARDNPDRWIARIIKNILRSGMSSRLFIKLRDEMGSGYYVSASHALHTSFGFFAIATGTTHGRVPEIVSAIIAETERLKTEPVSRAELDRVREFMRAQRLMGLETSDEIAGYCSEQEALEDRILTPEEFEAIFAKISPDDIMRVAKTIFAGNRLTAAAIGKGIDKDAVIRAIS
ncbi:MAG: insulinase family protein [Patescibacteria group bacterium]|nr:insulinase family protein [Patescibacteria group bacterium]MDE2116720.1 insulinase family protein [Patescibacteria group bacterium]